MRGDTGSAFSEYGALILLVAVLVAAVLLGSLPRNVSDLIRDGVCKVQSIVTGEECDDGSPEASDPNFLPEYCIREGHKEETGFEISIGFFELGQKYYFAKETLSDGRVVVTMMPSFEAAAEAKAGGGIDFGENSLKRETGGSLQVKLATGNTFFLEDEEQFQELKADIDKTRLEDIQDMTNPVGSRLSRWITEKVGIYEPPDLPPADVKTGTFGLEAEIGKPINKWRADNGATPEMNLTIGTKLDVAHWYDEPGNDKTARTYTYSGQGDLGVDRMGAHVNGGLSWSGATRIMRNEDGSLKNIRYSTTASGDWKAGVEGEDGATADVEAGGSQAVTQEIQLDFETPEEQAMGEQLLEDRGLLPPKNVMESMANPMMDPEEGGDINEDPGEDAEPYEQFAFDRARVWQYQSDVESTDMNFGAKAKMGISLGASFGWSTEDSSTTDAQILEGPENGERTFVRHEPCIAEEHRDRN
ncbi:hypothetical protein F4561_003802 [Lipingzhangella halophila]|uniref:Uncharacterized protein n=1 Tax=Lipingzhangella halophila TaxID=1783352 RepID=A0A7W7W3F0_9ACTN|nr:hypothetical protein [Lipingzhangella halophila]MBB4932982.1 hypothetical protein [Lipingzhangella halophila]